MNTRNLISALACTSALLAQGTQEIEPNDTTATATFVAKGAQAYGMIGTPGDIDLYRITLPYNTDLQCWINPGAAPALADSDLTLLAADGVTVLQFNDDQNAGTWLSTLIAGNVPAGTYYLQVRSSLATAPNDTGNYTLDIVQAPIGTYVATAGSPGIPTPVLEAAEVNDPRQSGGLATHAFENCLASGSLATSSPGTAFVDPLADFDFYSIQVTRPGLLRVETLATATAPAATDTVVYLARRNLTLLSTDDDGGTGQLSLLTRYVAPGNFLVAVKGKDTGNYQLQLTLTPAAAPGQATLTVRPGGCGPTLGVYSTSAGPTANLHTEAPVLGSAHYLNASGLQPNTFLFHVIGTETLTTFYDFGPLGAPGCFLEVLPIDQSPTFATASGEDFWRVGVPFRLDVIGLTVEQQIAAIDTQANSLQFVLSNRVSSVCGALH